MSLTCKLHTAATAIMARRTNVEQPRGAQEGGDKVLRYGLEKLREDRREVERILRQEERG